MSKKRDVEYGPEGADPCDEALQDLWTALNTVKMETERGRFGCAGYDQALDHMWETADAAMVTLDVIRDQVAALRGAVVAALNTLERDA